MSYDNLTTCLCICIVICGLVGGLFFHLEKYWLLLVMVVIMFICTMCYGFLTDKHNNNKPIYNIFVNDINYICNDYEITDTTIKLYFDDNTTIVLMLHYDTEIVIKKGD